MSCLGDCLDMGPPPDTILFMPPPPAPIFVVPDLTPVNTTHCFTAQICDPTVIWSPPGKVTVDHGEFLELPRKDIETNWNVSGIDDTWLLVLVASSIGVLLLGALLAMFLLKCREMNIFGGTDHCSLHSRDHQPIKNIDPRDCGALTSLNSKLIHPTDTNFYNGMSSMQDNRMVWAALTPRGTQHFISESYPRDLIDYGEPEDHYETIDSVNANRQPANHKANFEDYFSRQKDYDYEDPTPLIESYQMNSMDNLEEHQYQVIGNTDMRCANFGTNSLRRPFPIIQRPRVSSPTRIEHPNLPPLNLYPQRSNNNTLRKTATTSYRNVDTGVVPKYGI
ncbi:uncharacterized protein LOC115887032 isoform X2 [Sitophilus oryzae]|uniref:Uncharacterized protein LOC115887032 isoform X2 n=1 Tax=Sitophilus oryzae TaxID=7048 RepID=A0A6J2YEA7_SITOR|nr:uncharacterized protein LOC115887032 isoform X2 [Sitophilus oryzae]